MLVDNLECETTFAATQVTLPARIFGKLPAEKQEIRDALVEFMEYADEGELRRNRFDVVRMMMPEFAIPDPMTPLLETTKNASMSPRHNVSWGRDYNPLDTQ